MSEKPAPTTEPPLETPPQDAPAVVNKIVFGSSAVGVLAVALWAIVSPSQASDVIGTLVGWTSEWFGWFYIFLATVILVFVLFLGISRYGGTRLGPDHSRPEFSTFSWAAMLFAAGIGTDLMFFSVAEPVTQYLSPPTGKGQTLEAAREATVWTLFHYGITGWAMYSLMGMALGYFCYRMNLPLAIRSALYPIFGKKLDGPLGHAVDTAAVLGTIFGVATSLGIGVVQLNFGLKLLFGIDEGTAAQVGLIALAVVMATISAVTGVDKGIRLLSQLNVILAIGLAGWILVTGKTVFLLNAIVMNVGDFVTKFPGMTMETFAFDRPVDWLNGWTLFFWAWWIAWASFVGLFLARISRGRTIRQFVAGTMIIPFSYIVMWVSIFGNSAIEIVRSGDSSFGELAMNTPQEGFYTMLTMYPGATFIAGVATFVGLLFYVTSADSGALVMANLSSRLRSPLDDATNQVRIFWAVATGLLTAAMLIVGGVPALQNATIIMGLPFAFVLILVMLGLWRALRVEASRFDSRRAGLPGMFSGRSSEVDMAHAGRTWRDRLSRAMHFVEPDRARSHLDDVVEPALREVASEIEARGVPVEVSRGHEEGELDVRGHAEYVELVAGLDEEHPFRYRVELEEVPVPAYGGRFVSSHDTYARLEVHLLEGGQGYDLMDYTGLQVIHDVLDQYERHLEFLRLHQMPTT